MSVPSRAAGLVLAALLVAEMTGCGYRPLRGALPGGKQSVRVRLADASRIDEPELSVLLATELCRRLGRAGVRASTSGAAESELETRILALASGAPVLGPSGRTLAARRLGLRLELVLTSPDGDPLWRSGLVEVEETWPLDVTSSLTSEAARRHALARLAAEAAERAVLLMTSGL